MAEQILVCMLHQLTTLANLIGRFSDIEADLHVREPVRAGGLCWAGERVDLPFFCSVEFQKWQQCQNMSFLNKAER